MTGNPQLETLSGEVYVYARLKPTTGGDGARASGGMSALDLDTTDAPCLEAAVPAASDPDGGGEGGGSGVGANGTSKALPKGRQPVVAMLCVPARFVPTDLITFLSPLHAHIRAVRLVRHCDAPRQFAALIDLDTQASADELVQAYVAPPPCPANVTPPPTPTPPSPLPPLPCGRRQRR